MENLCRETKDKEKERVNVNVKESKKKRDSDASVSNPPSVEVPFPSLAVAHDEFPSRHSHMKYELRDTPGLGKCCFRRLHFMDFAGRAVVAAAVDRGGVY
ncbi:hypothetical protein LIER_20873 [Lithospermum erythrorhizon]|uniref:Uncharacterized protein n=1 Tax=Lithospermum erythrorhizon TaxID=34254 RepID=A0AAV3QN63_LITER